MTNMVPSVSIDTLIMKRDAMVERIRQAHGLLNEANALAEGMFGDEYRGHRLGLINYGSRRDFGSEDGLNDMISEVDGRAWSFLLRESGLQTFMDAEARQKWFKAIEKNDVPPLTRANIEATFSALYDARGDMFERGVIAVFRSLSWDYKTNTPVMFGKRLVLRRIVDTAGYASVCYDGANRLDDLTRVLSVLDGKPEPDYRHSTLRRMSEASWPREHQDIVLDYFSVRGFKNGNGHLTFSRPDLVDRMNAILAKHHPGALPASRHA
jgi:hypothetical protein